MSTIEKNKKQVGAQHLKKDGNNQFDLLGITAVSGISIKKAAELYVKLGISNLNELYQACKDGKLVDIKGWGLSTQQRIKSEIELNILWMHTQCTKIRKEGEGASGERFDREFLLNLVKEQAKVNLEKID